MSLFRVFTKLLWIYNIQLENHRICESRDVRFNEDEFRFRSLTRHEPLFDSDGEDPNEESFEPNDDCNVTEQQTPNVFDARRT